MQFYIDLLYVNLLNLYTELKPIIMNFFNCKVDNIETFQLACKADNVIKLKCSNIEQHIDQLLLTSVEHKAINCVNYLLELNPTNLNECLIIAAKSYSYDIVDKLLAKGADPNEAIAIKTSANITNLLMKKRSNILN